MNLSALPEDDSIYYNLFYWNNLPEIESLVVQRNFTIQSNLQIFDDVISPLDTI